MSNIHVTCETESAREHERLKELGAAEIGYRKALTLAKQENEVVKTQGGVRLAISAYETLTRFLANTGRRDDLEAMLREEAALSHDAAAAYTNVQFRLSAAEAEGRLFDLFAIRKDPQNELLSLATAQSELDKAFSEMDPEGKLPWTEWRVRLGRLEAAVRSDLGDNAVALTRLVDTATLAELLPLHSDPRDAGFHLEVARVTSFAVRLAFNLSKGAVEQGMRASGLAHLEKIAGFDLGSWRKEFETLRATLGSPVR